jgi:hypothetical protein
LSEQLPKRINIYLIVALLLLGWAGWEARQLEQGTLGVACEAGSDPAAVEKSFAPIMAKYKAGERENSLLALRQRAAKGPYPGYAYYLLGERAFGEKAWGAAVDNYKAGVKADSSVGDHRGAFESGKVILARLEEIKKGVWAGRSPEELKEVNYLLRRLSGGCN